MDGSGTLLVNKKDFARRVLKCSLPTLDAIIDRYPDFPVEQRGTNGVEWIIDAAKASEFLKEKREAENRAAQDRSELFAQFSLPIDDIAPEEARTMSPIQRAQLATAMLREHKLAQEAGHLLVKTEVRTRLATLLGQLGKFLDALPAQLAREYHLPDEVGRAIRSRIDERRRVFVRDASGLFEAASAAGDQLDLADGTNG